MPISDQQIHQFLLMAWNWAAVFIPRFCAAIALLVAGLGIAGWVSRVVARILSKAPHVDLALKPIISAVVRYALLTLTFIATLEQLGFRTTSLLAVLGAAGLAVGLALQGTLANIAAGIMLLWLRPFQVFDYIEVSGQGGSVKEIGLFGCILRTFDGMFLFVPNSTIWNAPLKNHTRNGGRLISIDVSIPLAGEIARAKETLLKTVSQTQEVLKQPPPAVFLQSLSSSAAVLTVSLWSTPQGAGEVERSVIENIKGELDGLGESFKPIQITRIIPPDTDPSRFLERREPVPL